MSEAGTPGACPVDLGRRERPSGGMDRKAEEEPIAELLATTTTPRGALRRLCGKHRCSRLKIHGTRLRPKLRLVWQPSAALTCCFADSGGGCPGYLLPQGERDRGADEVEGLALLAGRLGEDGDFCGRAGEPDLVAGQGGEVGEQAAEAAVGAAGLVVLAGCLRVGGC